MSKKIILGKYAIYQQMLSRGLHILLPLIVFWGGGQIELCDAKISEK